MTTILVRFDWVLIVAKCIVNHKYYYDRSLFYNVLIVAKCIVNEKQRSTIDKLIDVLIVAKCIVNQSKEIKVLDPFSY